MGDKEGGVGRFENEHANLVAGLVDVSLQQAQPGKHDRIEQVDRRVRENRLQVPRGVLDDPDDIAFDQVAVSGHGTRPFPGRLRAATRSHVRGPRRVAAEYGRPARTVSIVRPAPTRAASRYTPPMIGASPVTGSATAN
jgi:hypothetical protein